MLCVYGLTCMNTIFSTKLILKNLKNVKSFKSAGIYFTSIDYIFLCNLIIQFTKFPWFRELIPIFYDKNNRKRENENPLSTL